MMCSISVYSKGLQEKAYPRFSNLHLNKRQHKTKVEPFGHNAQTKHSISAQTPHTNCQARWWRLMIWACSAATKPGHLTVTESTINCKPKYSRVKCEAICPTAKAWLKLGHETGQWPPNEGLLQGLKRAANLDELKQRWKEEWSEDFLHLIENHYQKLLLKVLLRVVGSWGGRTRCFCLFT